MVGSVVSCHGRHTCTLQFALTQNSLAFAKVAKLRTSIVLPVPGGPWSNTPFVGRKGPAVDPIVTTSISIKSTATRSLLALTEENNCGKRIGHNISSSTTVFTSSLYKKIILYKIDKWCTYIPLMSVHRISYHEGKLQTNGYLGTRRVKLLTNSAVDSSKLDFSCGDELLGSEKELCLYKPPFLNNL